MLVSTVPYALSNAISFHAIAGRLGHPPTKKRESVIGRASRILFIGGAYYELQFDLARDVGLDYAPRQLFRFKIKPPT
jgi:hypothetical protein